MINWEQLVLFMYVSARMSGFVLLNPIFGRNNIPAMFRALIALVLSVCVMPMTQQTVAVPLGILEMSMRLLLEMAVGFALGMIINFFFYIPQLAGSLVDTQMGMTMNQIYDPGSQANMSTTGVLLNTLMLMLFFAANGHHTLLRIMMTSGEIVRYGAVSISTELARYMLDLFIQCTLFAVKLCMPILAAELVGQIGMGVLMKVIPQINVFAINIELKVIIGIGLILALISPISEYMLGLENNMLDAVESMLGIVSG